MFLGTIKRRQYLNDENKQVAAASGQPAYEYRFSYVAGSERSHVDGAGHASEIPYVFNAVKDAPRRPVESHRQRNGCNDDWLLGRVCKNLRSEWRRTPALARLFPLKPIFCSTSPMPEPLRPRSVEDTPRPDGKCGRRPSIILALAERSVWVPNQIAT